MCLSPVPPPAPRSASPASPSPGRKPSVLIVHAGEEPARHRGNRHAPVSGLFASVDAFDAHTDTPSIDLLTNYDAAMVWNFDTWLDRVSLGNTLAQYVDLGYGVVQTMFTTAGAIGSNLGATGPLPTTASAFGFGNVGSVATLGSVAPRSPGHERRLRLRRRHAHARPSNNSLTRAPRSSPRGRIAKPLVVADPRSTASTLALSTLHKLSSTAGWTASGDGAKLMANADGHHPPQNPPLRRDRQAFLRSKFHRRHQSPPGERILLHNFAVQRPQRHTSLELLKEYGAVLTWSTQSYHNSAAMGNVLADYVDEGLRRRRRRRHQHDQQQIARRPLVERRLRPHYPGRRVYNRHRFDGNRLEQHAPDHERCLQL